MLTLGSQAFSATAFSNALITIPTFPDLFTTAAEAPTLPERYTFLEQ